MELAAHEIEGLRRSLAIGNGLPSDQIARLIETCSGQFLRYRELELRDERLRAELDAHDLSSLNSGNDSPRSPAT